MALTKNERLIMETLKDTRYTSIARLARDLGLNYTQTNVLVNSLTAGNLIRGLELTMDGYFELFAEYEKEGTVSSVKEAMEQEMQAKAALQAEQGQ